MRKMIGLFIILVIAILMAGCTDYLPRKEQLKDVLLGEQKLVKRKEWRNTDSEIGGVFFLFMGGISGKTTSYSSLQFCWENKLNQMTISELPFSMIRFDIDNSKKIPTVEFIFNDVWLDVNTYSEQKNNLNKHLDHYWLEIAIIRISREQFNKEFAEIKD